MIQRRIDGTVDFNRDWKSYKEGFGKAKGEYWLGKYYKSQIYKVVKDLSSKR